MNSHIPLNSKLGDFQIQESRLPAYTADNALEALRRKGRIRHCHAVKGEAEDILLRPDTYQRALRHVPRCGDWCASRLCPLCATRAIVLETPYKTALPIAQQTRADYIDKRLKFWRKPARFLFKLLFCLARWRSLRNTRAALSGKSTFMKYASQEVKYEEAGSYSTCKSSHAHEVREARIESDRELAELAREEASIIEKQEALKERAQRRPYVATAMEKFLRDKGRSPQDAGKVADSILHWIDPSRYPQLTDNQKLEGRALLDFLEFVGEGRGDR